jgi:RecB family exonuclease
MHGNGLEKGGTMSKFYHVIREGEHRWISAPNNGGECCLTKEDTVEELNQLIQNRDEWRNLAKMMAQLQFDEFHAGGEALIDQHNAARELYEKLRKVEL